MATKTPNYGLTKPAETDFYDIKIFNDNADTIDTQIKRNADAAAYYGTCSTAAATDAKVVTCAGFTLRTGARISVAFSIANTATAPKLNVNSTGAKPITRLSNWDAGSTVDFVYDGANWRMIEGLGRGVYYGTCSTPGHMIRQVRHWRRLCTMVCVITIA